MSGERVVVTADYLRCMGKLANKRKTRPSRIKKSVPTKTPRKLLDAKKLGLTLMALIFISMDLHTPERFANFELNVGLLPEVLECLLITGQNADYQLKVVVRDMDHYQALLLDKVSRIKGVTGVHSIFVLRQVVVKTALDVASLAH